MILLMPCEDPRSLGMSNRSSPRTRMPRRARWYAVALPIPPTPATITSYMDRWYDGQKASLLLLEHPRCDRGGVEAESADAGEHEHDGDDAAAGGDRVDVAVADGGD